MRFSSLGFVNGLFIKNNDFSVKGANPIARQLINEYITGFNNSLFGQYEGNNTFEEHLGQGFLNIGRYFKGYGSFGDLGKEANLGTYFTAYSRAHFTTTVFFHYHNLLIAKQGKTIE